MGRDRDSCPATSVRATPRSATCGCINLLQAREGPLIVLLDGFPEFWYGWRQQIRAARGSRSTAWSARPEHARLDLSSKPDGVAAYDTNLLAADIRGLIHERGAETAMLVGHDWGGTIAWATAMNYPEVVDRLATSTRPTAEAIAGTAPPRTARKSWYFFFFDLPDLPETVVHANRWHFFRHFLRDARPPPITPEETDRYVEAWSQPGAATGMINYYRSSVRTVAEEGRSGASPDLRRPTLVLWGQRDRYLGPGTRRARPRRRAQPGPRRAAARRLALGPPRRARARQPAAHRLFHPRPDSREPPNIDEVTGAQATSATYQAAFTGPVSQVRLLAGNGAAPAGILGRRRSAEGLCPSRRPASGASTVEWRLRKIFTKLGIGSPRELREVLSAITMTLAQTTVRSVKRLSLFRTDRGITVRTHHRTSRSGHATTA